MLTKEDLTKFFAVLESIESTAPITAKEVEEIHNSVFGYTYFMTVKDKHPSVHVNTEDGIYVEYYSGGGTDSLSIPLYAFTDPDWQQEYRVAQEKAFQDSQEKAKQKENSARESNLDARKRMYEKLKVEFEVQT